MSDSTPETKPALALVLGAMGSFVLAALLLVSFLIQFTHWRALSPGGAPVRLTLGSLMLVGSLLSAPGWLRLGRLYGGKNTVAGVFSFLVPAAVLIMVVGLVVKSWLIVKVGQFGTLLFVPLIALFGGLGLLGTATKSPHPRLFQVGGVLLAAAGAVGFVIAVLVIGEIRVSLGRPLGWTYSLVGCVGFVLAGIAMLRTRR